MEDNPADVAIKTHALDSYRYTHAIHLVRSPFDVLDSFYDWKRSSGWQWRHGEVAWEPFVKLIAHKWRDHTRHWLDARCTTYRIRYEDCRRDPVTNFADLLGWMGIDIPRSLLAQAVEATAFEKLKKTQIGSSAVRNNFFRRGQVNRGIERFSTEQRQWLVDLARQELLACGYHDLVKSVDAGETIPARQEH